VHVVHLKVEIQVSLIVNEKKTTIGKDVTGGLLFVFVVLIQAIEETED